MTAIALHQAFQDIYNFTDEMGLPLNQKNATTLKKFILISTDTGSLENSKKMLGILQRVKESLPDTQDKVDIDKIKYQLETINESLLKVNSMFEFVKSIFDTGDSEGAEVNIDDGSMYDFLANMEKSKAVMEYISDYLQLLLKINKANSGPKQHFTCEELIEFINDHNNEECLQ